MGEQRETIDDQALETEMVRYLVDGRRFDIPLGFHWWQRVELGYWPKPKDEYTETSSFTINAALPDLKPYLQSTRALFDEKEGHGQIITVSIQSKLLGRRPLKEYLSMLKLGKLVEDESLQGLIHYEDMTSSNISDLYLLAVQDPAEDFRITCDRRIGNVHYPSCEVRDYFHDKYGVVDITYNFNRQYLSNWKEIRRKVAELVAGFDNKISRQ